ncbi:hypothetical protein CY35_20G019400 [Sphagnum magellanicum]|nr:hypothetical protein CY35_20G019400 [Sphagnum magellanicum]
MAPATNVEGLFLVLTPLEEIVLSAESTDLVLKHLNPHAVAAGVLLYLKELNGSLLTSSLHDAFIAAAAIPNLYSRLYVFRLLLNRLPSSNYALLRSIAFLLLQVSSSNKGTNAKRMETTFGPLLLRRSDDAAIVHR